MKPRLSLQGRALQCLAQREHSRDELRRKLLGHARRAADPAAPGDDDAQAATEVERVLDGLEAQGHLSQARFAESRVHARQARWGNLRIRRELAQHGVELDPQAAQALKDSELARATEVRARKFGALPADAAERARQMRFLASRGFSSEVIRRVLRGGADGTGED